MFIKIMVNENHYLNEHFNLQHSSCFIQLDCRVPDISKYMQRENSVDPFDFQNSTISGLRVEIIQQASF